MEETSLLDRLFEIAWQLTFWVLIPAIDLFIASLCSIIWDSWLAGFGFVLLSLCLAGLVWLSVKIRGGAGRC